jgi:hypothetical protein
MTVVTLGISSASAQPGPLYVSALGDDGNSGDSPDKPLRTITRALSYGAPDIVILDSGLYDTFSVTSSVIIEAASGAVALIPLTSASAAATINVAPTETVVLRGLSFTGGGPNFGIMTTRGNVTIENCVVSNFKNWGIYQDTPLCVLTVKDSVVRNCGRGIFINSSQPGMFVVGTIEHCRLENNLYGVVAYDNARVTVRDSIASNNTYYGFQAAALPGWTAELTIENCLANGNNVGVIADNTWAGIVIVRVSNSTATSNQTGFRQMGATTFYSKGNNTVHGNVSSNVQGVITPMNGV